MHFIRYSRYRIAKGTLSTFSCDKPQNGFQLTEKYILGPSGEELTMLNGSGNWKRTNIYGGDALLATLEAQNVTSSPTPPTLRGGRGASWPAGPG